MAQASIHVSSRTEKWAWQELLKYGGHERTCAAVRLVAQGECSCGWVTVKKLAQKQLKSDF